jgi:hypothetical protein
MYGLYIHMKIKKPLLTKRLFLFRKNRIEKLKPILLFHQSQIQRRNDEEREEG